MKKLLPITLLLTAGIVDVASAAMPGFNATCPNQIQVHADQGGYVYINGKQAQLKKFNNNAYEAKLKGGNVTISITINPDKSVSVAYTGPGRANGICQVAD
jgi:biopolymer transport protein ExbD